MIVLRVIAAVVAILSVTLGCALAHAVKISSDPEDGSRIENSPREIVLQFSEPVVPVRIHLAGSSTRPVPRPGKAEVENSLIRVPLPHPLEPGSYILSYSVTSIDGHPVYGSIAFGIGEASGAIQPPKAISQDWLTALSRAVHYGFLLAATGGGLFTLLVLRGQHLPATLLRGLLTFSAVAAVSLVLSVGLAGLQLLGLGLPGLATVEPWVAGMRTSLFASATAGLAGLLLLSFALFHRVSVLGRLGIGCGSLLALTSLALTGHAATAPPAWTSAPAVYLHGITAAFWAGSLWPLWVLLKRMTSADGVLMVRRFSSLAIGLVATLIAAGFLLSVIQIGSLGAIRDTPYGWVWALKMALVVPLVGLATANRQILLPNLAERGPELLRRSIAVEAVLLMAIALVTALLGQIPPPRAYGAAELKPSSISGQVQPVVQEIVSGDYVAKLRISPATSGNNTITILVTDRKGNSKVPKEIIAHWSLPSAGIDGLERPLSQESGDFSGIVELPLPGRWLVQIEVLVSDFEKAIFVAETDIK